MRLSNQFLPHGNKEELNTSVSPIFSFFTSSFFFALLKLEQDLSVTASLLDSIDKSLKMFDNFSNKTLSVPNPFQMSMMCLIILNFLYPKTLETFIN